MPFKTAIWGSLILLALLLPDLSKAQDTPALLDQMIRQSQTLDQTVSQMQRSWHQYIASQHSNRTADKTEFLQGQTVYYSVIITNSNGFLSNAQNIGSEELIMVGNGMITDFTNYLNTFTALVATDEDISPQDISTLNGILNALRVPTDCIRREIQTIRNGL